MSATAPLGSAGAVGREELEPASLMVAAMAALALAPALLAGFWLLNPAGAAGVVIGVLTLRRVERRSRSFRWAAFGTAASAAGVLAGWVLFYEVFYAA